MENRNAEEKKKEKKPEAHIPESVVHEFPPVWDGNSRILILGTFPSVKSREQHFYYGHPQNRFWKVMAALTKSETPETIEAGTNCRFVPENAAGVLPLEIKPPEGGRKRGNVNAAKNDNRRL